MNSLEASIKVNNVFKLATKETKAYELKLLEMNKLENRVIYQYNYFEKKKRFIISKKTMAYKIKMFKKFAKKEGISFKYIMKIAGYEV